MSVIVTGGAGFIGSCLVRTLNDLGYTNIIVVDHIAQTDKWKNLTNKSYSEYINRDDFLRRLPEFSGKTEFVFHMGACSSTTERDFDFLYRNNFEYTKTLWKFCTQEQIPFLYASSAATYGGGENGFDDSRDIKALCPLNGYGYSKQLFDLWAEKQKKAPPPALWVQVLQRLRAERIFQGKHGQRYPPFLPPDRRNRQGEAVQILPSGLRGRHAVPRFRLCKGYL